MDSSRRELIGAAAGLGALAALGLPGCARRAASPVAQSAPDTARELPFRISLAEWSHHRALRSGALVHEDFAALTRERYGLEAVEYVNSFFKDRARDDAYLAELRRRADDAGVAILLIMCDGEGELGHAEAEERARAVENHLRWLDAARALGCHSIRVNAAGSGSPEEHAARVAESLVALAERGGGLNVIVENHGGRSSDGAWLAGVMRRAAHPRVGTLPDFGNFRIDAQREYDRYQGVAELMPFAKAVSAKSHDFDERGEETGTDYRRMLRIVHAAGYRGWIGIEYEGARLPEDEGILATRRLLERLRDELA